MLNLHKTYYTHRITACQAYNVQAIQKLWAEIDLERGHTKSGGSKLRMYRAFKSDVREAEPYLFLIANPKIRQDYTKFRISDHNLHTETGRRTKPPTPTANRTCSLCQSTSIENEVHFLVDCNYYSDLRSSLTHLATSLNHYYQYLCSKEKFMFLMCSRNPSIINQLAYFIHKAMQLRSSYLYPPTQHS